MVQTQAILGAGFTSFFLFVFALVPSVAGAQSFNYLDNVVLSVGAAIGILVPVLIAIALALFLWGLVVFMFQSDSDQARADGRQRMVWGVIILFVAVSVWGIVELLYQITGLEDNPNVEAPDTSFLGIGGGGGGGAPGGGGGGGNGGGGGIGTPEPRPDFPPPPPAI